MSVAQTATILDAFETLVKAAHDNSKRKGFWGPLYEDSGDMTGHPQNHPNVGEKLMLFVSEAAELFEAHRKGKEDAPCDKDCTIIDPKAKGFVCDCKDCKGYGGNEPDAMNTWTCKTCGGTGKSITDGVRRLTNCEEELADIVIRVMDYAGFKGIDLGRCILAKMQYNSSRPYMHGKRC